MIDCEQSFMLKINLLFLKIKYPTSPNFSNPRNELTLTDSLVVIENDACLAKDFLANTALAV